MPPGEIGSAAVSEPSGARKFHCLYAHFPDSAALAAVASIDPVSSGSNGPRSTVEAVAM
jgi:hypothetical protein